MENTGNKERKDSLWIRIFSFAAALCFLIFMIWSPVSMLQSASSSVSSASSSSSSSGSSPASSDSGVVFLIILGILGLAYALCLGLLSRKMPKWIFPVSHGLGIAGTFVLGILFVVVLALIYSFVAPFCAIASSSSAASAASSSSSSSGSCMSGQDSMNALIGFMVTVAAFNIPLFISSIVSISVKAKWQEIILLITTIIGSVSYFALALDILITLPQVGFLALLFAGMGLLEVSSFLIEKPTAIAA
jgi:hypothetical protein